jgi:hypothetical protein
MTKTKILITSMIFYIIGILITLAMFKLWFFIFESQLWQKIFIIITLLGSIKYFWSDTDWMIDQLSKTKNK